ncbi:integrase catalytic domain-containing protein [Trichonephila clavipes]|nr:integrase catalytic domain-containing protein [Trichonephila clavipes]
MVQTEHAPFSPDLNPPDFFLFSRLKLALKGERFDDISDIQRNVTRFLNSISKEDFLQRFQDMYSRPQRSIVMRGDYFEGQIRQFSGDIKDWLQFWNQFQHIHDDDEIAPENKFQYLVQATVNGSRAREVVESFPTTAANYAKAVDSLKARFGKDDLLVEVYVRELLKLIISVQKQEKKISMTSLYDKLRILDKSLRDFRSNNSTEKCASILYPMFESCFQEDFLKAWNRSATSAASTDAKERLTNLMTFSRQK